VCAAKTAGNVGSKLLIFVPRRANDRGLSSSSLSRHCARCDAGRESMLDPALVGNVVGAGRQHNVLPKRQEFTMAVLVIFRAKGNSQDLLARYDATLADAIATAPLVPKHIFAPPLATRS